ncbi:MAG TPA: glucosamine-6-phosphate deaminase [Firmicutes bacterium]|nr:glucosamine-6-phosphate deaminase [Bacillota bacterium]
MDLIVKKDYSEVCAYTAQYTADFIRRHPDSLVTLAAGDTMLGVFQKLVELGAQGAVDLASVYYVSLDEWGGVGYETKGSCKQVLYDCFFTPAGVPEERICFFDGLNPQAAEECARVAGYVEAHGPIGLAVLGIGMNGHVGFNEPYTRQDSACLTVRLDPVTRTVSSKYFGQATKSDYGITLGMSTLLASSQVLLVANGEKKTGVVHKALNDMPSMAVPATMFRSHKQCELVVDRAAV